MQVGNSISTLSEDLSLSLPVSYDFTVATTEWQDVKENIIYGIPSVSVPTSAIAVYQEYPVAGNMKLATNFCNRHVLIADFDDTDNGLFLAIGRIDNGATTISGTLHSFDSSFMSKSDGTFTGQFWYKYSTYWCRPCRYRRKFL